MNEEIKDGIYVAEQIGADRLDIHKDPNVDWIAVLKQLLEDLQNKTCEIRT